MIRSVLNNFVSFGDIGVENEKWFYEGVRFFFREVFEYVFNYMLVNDEFFVNVEMVYFEEREKFFFILWCCILYKGNIKLIVFKLMSL